MRSTRRGVKVTPDTAARIARVVSIVERGDRDRGAQKIRTAGDDDPLRVCKTTEFFLRGDTQELELWELSEPGDEEQTPGQTITAFNNLRGIRPGRIVLVSRTLNGGWYVVAAEPEALCATAAAGNDPLVLGDSWNETFDGQECLVVNKTGLIVPGSTYTVLFDYDHPYQSGLIPAYAVASNTPSVFSGTFDGGWPKNSDKQVEVSLFGKVFQALATNRMADIPSTAVFKNCIIGTDGTIATDLQNRVTGMALIAVECAND